jgi:uncharacterized protein (TIGR00730 family)
MNISTVTVFCASSSMAGNEFVEETRILAQNLVKENILIQYGGGPIGLMGKLADTVLRLNGEIRGVIPKFMINEGWAHTGVRDMVEVDSIQERKKIIMMETDAIVALPGGYGTLEELTEAITLKQLGLISIPIIIVNIKGYYDKLLDFFSVMLENKFIKKDHNHTWQIVEKSEEVIPALRNAEKWDPIRARNNAAI